MKQNIILSLDKDVIRKAKVIAAQRQTSISRMLSQELTKIVDQQGQYRRAKIDALNHGQIIEGIRIDNPLAHR